MSNFHATAVFAARGSSQEETDRAAAALFKILRHPRVLYYEHDTSGETGPYPPATSLYFSVIADFDVEAPSEEQAGEMAEEVLDTLSTDALQYLALGLTAGEQRVRPEPRAAREPEQPAPPEPGRRALREEEEREPGRETRPDRGAREDRGGRGRGSRGRDRRRGAERQAESAREEEPQELLTRPLEEEPAEPVGKAAAPTPAAPVAVNVPAPSAVIERELPVPAAETAALELPPPPPPRSSPSMRVTLSVSLRASELSPPINGVALPDREELIALAIAEARRRHPELPADIAPEPAVVLQQGGETVLTLTWHYAVPVPSATDVT